MMYQSDFPRRSLTEIDRKCFSTMLYGVVTSDLSEDGNWELDHSCTSLRTLLNEAAPSIRQFLSLHFGEGDISGRHKGAIPNRPSLISAAFTPEQ